MPPTIICSTCPRLARLRFMQENCEPPRIGLAASLERQRVEEISLQHWKGDRILRERFFYDSSKLRPMTGV